MSPKRRSETEDGDEGEAKPRGRSLNWLAHEECAWGLARLAADEIGDGSGGAASTKIRYETAREQYAKQLDSVLTRFHEGHPWEGKGEHTVEYSKANRIPEWRETGKKKKPPPTENKWAVIKAAAVKLTCYYVQWASQAVRSAPPTPLTSALACSVRCPLCARLHTEWRQASQRHTGGRLRGGHPGQGVGGRVRREEEEVCSGQSCTGSKEGR